MISLVNTENQDSFFSLCDTDIVFAPELSTQFSIYQHHAKDALFWLVTTPLGKPTAAVSRLSGCITIAATDQMDTEELASFLRMLGDYRQVQTNYALCRSLSRTLGGKVCGASSMRYLPNAAAPPALPCIQSPQLEELYSFLCAAFPMFSPGGWSEWYVYHSHLFRHNLGFAAGIYQNGTLISTGGVYATNRHYSLMANIATSPAFRGCGYGAQLVAYLCAEICRQGKTPVLHCAQESLVRFYASLGFIPTQHWGTLQQY